MIFFAEIQWESYTTLKNYKHISLPGTLMLMNVILKRQVYSRNVSVSVNWRIHKNHRHLDADCTTSKIYCILQTSRISTEPNASIYYLFGNIPYFYKPPPNPNTLAQKLNLVLTSIYANDKLKTTSWNEASGVCRSVGSVLPYFTSRNEFVDFINLLKHTPHIPPLEAVFIGLTNVEHQVILL